MRAVERALKQANVEILGFWILAIFTSKNTAQSHDFDTIVVGYILRNTSSKLVKPV